MSNYTQTTDFSAKDSLASGDANKIITGASVDVEFAAISTAIATKADDSAVVHLAGAETITGAKTFGALVTFKKGADIASAATIDLSTATGNLVIVTGTTATSAVTMTSGQIVRCVASGAWPLTYHATTNKINSGGANVTLAAGDQVLYHYDGTTVRGYISKADGTAVVAPSVATQAEQVTGTDITKMVTPGRQQYHKSSVKSWLRFNGTGTAAINGSYNITSITDDGTGIYTITLDVDHADQNYAIAGACKTTSDASNEADYICCLPTAVGTYFMETINGNGARGDKAFVCAATFGILA